MILINGKTADKLIEADLQALINNDEYTESQFIDYKEMFGFEDSRLDNSKRKEEILEFKNDVCSFANADGGYIIVGITEQGGTPDSIVGIEIPNRDTEAYERKIREKLIRIQPKIPAVKIYYINLQSGKYVVILEIISDGFAPYVYCEENKSFDFVIRDGAQKRKMSYNQIMRMFNQSLVLSEKIEKFRQDRINNYLKSNNINYYFRLYVISDDFVDVSSYKKIYLMYQENRSLISNPGNAEYISPNVDGIKFASPHRIGSNYIEGYIFNSGICEFLVRFDNIYLHNENNTYFLSFSGLWKEEINKYLDYSIKVLLELKFSSRAYLCFDLFCPYGTITFKNEYGNSTTDRDLIVSSPIEIEDMANAEILHKAKIDFYHEYLMALGIRDPQIYKDFE